MTAAAALMAAAWLYQALGYQGSHLVYAGLMAAAALVSGQVLARRAVEGLRMRVATIELLVSVAAAGALAIGEYWEAAAVTVLFDLGGYLEWKTLERARAAIRELAEWVPRTARVRRPDGSEAAVRVEEVRPGDVMVVRSGEKLAADGVVVRGEAEVDESALTGEPMPVSKAIGDRVMAGSVTVVGFIEVRATRVGEETTFGRILQLVGEAQEARPRVQTAVERFARYYTPGILGLSAATLLITRDTRLALTLLVVGCPGALVLAAPVSIVAGLGHAARNGILIKGGRRLDTLAAVDALAFDKTGTLTAGRPEVVAVHTLAGPTGTESDETAEASLLRLAAAVEKGSEHPLAAALLERAARARGVGSIPDPQRLRVYPGRGVAAHVGGQRVLVGNRRLMEAEGVHPEPRAAELAALEESQGRTAVLVAVDGRVAGVLALADRVRESAARMIEALRQAGVRRTVILTGDGELTAGMVGRSVGIDEVRARLLPEEKVREIARLKAQGYTVAMVGDGINDAPALAAADVSIAIGAGGTDAAMEAADVALIADDLEKIPYAVGLAKAIVANIRQNLAFAVVVVLSLVAGVLGGVVHLASGMLVHELSVLLVILNGMRLLRWRPASQPASRRPFHPRSGRTLSPAPGGSVP
ncbi:MAG: cation-translocating P-type ATPase [Limnochordaceae bacterium]|nr:cation-translocating P-type ATPase [Limnochordaceae bacterium]